MSRLMIVLVGVLLCLATTIQSGEIDLKTGNEYNCNSCPNNSYFEFALGTNYRIDETQYMEYSPPINAYLFYWFSGWGAIRTKIGYNYAIRMRGGDEYSSLTYDIGVRFQEYARHITPFIETGYSIVKYNRRNNSTGQLAGKKGLFLAAGLSFNISGNIKLDISVYQVINRLFIVMYDSYMGTLPEDPGPEPYYWRPFGSSNDIPRKFYNPSTVELIVRVRL